MWQLLHIKCLNECLSHRNAQLITAAAVVIFIIPEDFVNRLTSDGCPIAIMPDHGQLS